MRTRTIPALVRQWFIPLAASVALAACSSSDNGGGGSSTSDSYDGTFASADFSGTVAVTVPTASASIAAPVTGPAPSFDLNGASAINVTATLHITGGGTVNLTGTLNGVALAMAGTGYTFSGTLTGSGTSRQISGTFTDPNGNTGTFSVHVSASGTHAKAYCGAYTGTDNGDPDGGTFNLVIGSEGSGGAIIVNSNGDAGYLAAHTVSNQLQMYDPQAPNITIAQTTTYNATNVAGTYDDHQGSSGTFAGSVAACQ